MRRLIAGAAVGLVGCTGSGAPSPSPATSGTAPVSQAVADDAVLGLCEAIAALPGDPDAAKAAFLDRAHQPIHLVAAALQPVDAQLAADLLVAKQAVEADLALGPPAGEHLDSLLDATRAAVERIGLSAPVCPS